MQPKCQTSHCLRWFHAFCNMYVQKHACLVCLSHSCGLNNVMTLVAKCNAHQISQPRRRHRLSICMHFTSVGTWSWTVKYTSSHLLKLLLLLSCLLHCHGPDDNDASSIHRSLPLACTHNSLKKLTIYCYVGMWPRQNQGKDATHSGTASAIDNLKPIAQNQLGCLLCQSEWQRQLKGESLTAHPLRPIDNALAL